MLTLFHHGWHLPALLLALAFRSGDSTMLLRAQTGGASPQNTTSKAPAYEVVSIKPTSASGRDTGWKTLPNGFDFRDLPLSLLINQAYGIQMDGQIAGLPEWVKVDHYNVSARVDDDTAEAWKKLSNQDRLKQQEPMLQALLADRCQLKMRREVKVLSVYVLVIAKSGLKMKEAAQDQEESSIWKQTAYYSSTSQGDEYTITVTTQAGTALSLAQSLPRYAGRIVVDKTGLGDKSFDFELKWSTSGQAPPDGGDIGPSLFKALEEQLGLKLEPAKEPVDTFVVERLERPSPN